MIETYKNYNKETPILESSKDYPNEAAICNALAYAGYTLPQGLFSQACESLGDFMKSNEEVDNTYKSVAPTLYSDYRAKMPGYYKPSDIISVLITGVNKWIGKDVLTFKEASEEYIISEIDHDRPVLVVISDGKTHKLVPILGKKSDVLESSDEDFNTKNFKIKPFNAENKWVITVTLPEPVI